jgi:hypothetical protein
MLAEFTYLNLKNEALERLARKKADFDKYKLKEGANEFIINRNEDDICNELLFIKSTEEMRLELIGDKLKAFSKGADSVKRQETKRLSGEPCKRTEKEAWRAWNISELQRQMPQLF